MPSNKRKLSTPLDYLTIDSEDHYLISAHLAAGQTYLIDLRTNKVVATVADTDMRQMKVVKSCRPNASLMGARMPRPSTKLYVSDERGKAEAIVDVIQGQDCEDPAIQ